MNDKEKFSEVTHYTHVDVQPGGINIQHVEHLHQADILSALGIELEVKKKDGSEQSKDLRSAIDQLLPLISQNRHWFGVAKALMWRGWVADGDFAGAVSLLESLYPDGLPYRPDSNDLSSKVNVGTWSKTLDRWDINDCPVQQYNRYSQYVAVAERALTLIPQK